MFLDKDIFERTVWHIAAKGGRIEVLNKLRELAKEVLTQKELKSVFFGKDKFDGTTWYIAA
jgi:hypothetical protein